MFININFSTLNQAMSESIYTIIPQEENPPPKGSIYKSKYPPNIPPTGSTFCHHTTSQPIVLYYLCRHPILMVNSVEDFKLIPNTRPIKPLAISKEIENHPLKNF